MFAQACKSRISKRISFLCFARCCTVLRSRWYQSGIKTPGIMGRFWLCRTGAMQVHGYEHPRTHLPRTRVNKHADFRAFHLLGTWVYKGYLRGPGPPRAERPRSCFLPTTGKDTGPGFLYGSSSVSSPVRSHVAALPTTLSGSSGASIIVSAVLNSTSVARRSLYILCLSHLGGT